MLFLVKDLAKKNHNKQNNSIWPTRVGIHGMACFVTAQTDCQTRTPRQATWSSIHNSWGNKSGNTLHSEAWTETPGVVYSEYVLNCTEQTIVSPGTQGPSSLCVLVCVRVRVCLCVGCVCHVMCGGVHGDQALFCCVNVKVLPLDQCGKTPLLNP